ncbi:MAG: glycosyltransferase [Luteolibacter sp.]
MTPPISRTTSIKNGKTRKIRILQLVTSLEPGGLENGVVNLTNGLDPDCFDTTIVCLERVGDFAERLRDGIRVICLEKPQGFRFPAVRKLAEIIRREQADIVHTHNFSPLIYGCLANVLTGCRTAILQGEHGQLRSEEMTSKRRLLRHAGYRVCRAIHTVSAGLKSDLVGQGFSGDKMKVILNGVDCGRFTPATDKQRASLRESWKLGEDSAVIGIVGRFVALKGHARLIEAFERLASEHPHLRLLIVGDHGSERESILRQIEESPVSNKIVWSGYQQDPVNFYRMMDLLVVPSESEGLSNVMLEAMACGVPCLAHPACGANEVIVDGENGMLREMSTPDALFTAIGGIAFDVSRLDALATGARQTAKQRFSLAAMVAGYGELYREMCADS